jgi:hypothetical protein
MAQEAWMAIVSAVAPNLQCCIATKRLVSIAERH